MDRDDYTDENYSQPHVPPATPPVIDSNADADDAATRPMDSGDSDFPGSRPGSFPRGAEDDEIQSGTTPDEARPGRGGDTIDPSAPDEVDPEPGDTDEPGVTPAETEPASTPVETPMPPD